MGWKLPLAHFIARHELQNEQSRRNRIFKKMAIPYIVNVVVKELDASKVWKSKKQREEVIARIEAEVLTLIKGESK
jgi:hypothetical protein